jgi:hypothetical protein
MLCRLIPLFFLIGCAQAMATPLPPEERLEFAATVTSSCMRGQATNPANQNITVGQVQDYCGCYGKSISETVTAEAIQQNDDKALDVLAAASSKACASTLTKK